tara:strand:- start:40 stop:222 length:183 start_codon:yes stop_codon:yes gene_type:complete
MNINEFINKYVSLIIGPAVGGRGTIGFCLKNNTKIFFKDSKMSKEESIRLSKHYKKEGIR